MDILNSETYKVAVTIVRDFSSIISMVAAGFGAAIGLFWTNKWQDRRLQAQINREDARKRLEKNLEIQKDVFLRTAESIQYLHTLIFEYCDANSNIESMKDKLVSQQASLAQIHLIGNEELILAIAKLGRLMSFHVNKISSTRILHNQHRTALSILEASLLEAKQQPLANADPNASIEIANIKSSPTYHQAYANRLEKEIKEIKGKLDALSMELFSLAIEASDAIRHVSVEIIIIARSQLGTPILSPKYEQEMKEISALNKEALFRLMGNKGSSAPTPPNETPSNQPHTS